MMPPIPFHTMIEPFRIHSLEPMRMTTQEDSQRVVLVAGHHLFPFRHVIPAHRAGLRTGQERAAQHALSDSP